MKQIKIIMFSLLIHLSIEEESWVTIPCTAKTERDLKYRKITWYKVKEGSDDITGLVLKDLYKNITTLFKFASHSYEVSENNSLLIPDTAEEDCGIYRCTLWPPLGHYIQEGDFEYYAADCTKPQLQPVSSKRDAVSTRSHLQFLLIPCVLVACSIALLLVIMLIKKKGHKKEKCVKV